MMLWYLAFCYAISFYIQLWIATVAFSPKMEKRRGFAKRAFLGSLFVILLGSLTYQILCYGKTWFVTNMAFYFLMAAYVVIAVRIIYQVDFLEAFDVTLTGYMVQNLSSQISQIFISNKTIAMRSIWNMVERESTRSMLTMATAFFGTLPLIYSLSSEKGYADLYQKNQTENGRHFFDIPDCCCIFEQLPRQPCRGKSFADDRKPAFIHHVLPASFDHEVQYSGTQCSGTGKGAFAAVARGGTQAV